MYVVMKDDYVEVILMIGRFIGLIFEFCKNEVWCYFKWVLMKIGVEGYIFEVLIVLIFGEFLCYFYYCFCNIDECLMVIIEVLVLLCVVEKCFGIIGCECSCWMKDG